MTAMDLFHLNRCNLDPLTETFNLAFYLEYLSKWPQLCLVLEDHNSQVEGYSMYDDSLCPLSSTAPAFEINLVPNADCSFSSLASSSRET